MSHSLRQITNTLLFWLILLGLSACNENVRPVANNAQPQQDSKPTIIKHEMSTHPILRVETGTHIAFTNVITVDATERYLVTGSNDKTVRVWSLTDGQLLRVLRPPIGEGAEGMIFAAAISPDGETVAVGGYTGYDWSNDDSHSIYLFNRATGKLQYRVTGGLLGGINHLAYSPDGRYLVVNLAQNGIRIYRTTDNQLQSEDRDCGGQSYSTEFDRQGRIVTLCGDSYIRLYDNSFHLLAKRLAPGGKPYTAHFSPNGDKIVVIFGDSKQINVLAGNDLRFLYNLNNVDDVRLLDIAWSEDGNLLYAGGMIKHKSKPIDIEVILRWSDAGHGKAEILPGFKPSDNNSLIFRLRALRKGSLVFLTEEPRLGVLNADGDKRWDRRTDRIDFTTLDQFLISTKGETVQFGLSGKQQVRFALDKHHLSMLTPETGNLPNLQAPITHLAKAGFMVTDWRGNSFPKFNGRALITSRDNELSRSFAISPDGQWFLLGTQWHLRLFDKQGIEKKPMLDPNEKVWGVRISRDGKASVVPKYETAKQVPIAWGVNISGDSKVAVAALGDGTIRWYRLSDLKELLALFPHNDGKRWVVWTPQGYYDASAGAEDLVGWHVNRGVDKESDFFPVGQFRNQFYRPDIIAKVLDTLNVEEAIKLANAERGKPEPQNVQIIAPVVTLLSPEEGATFTTPEVTLRYQIRNAYTNIKVLVDGRPLNTGKGFQVTPVTNQDQTLSITLPQQNVAISLIAENREIASQPATINLRWQGQSPPTQSAEEFIIKPKLYLLAVGVSKYDNPQYTLQFPAKDAQDFAEAFQQQKGKLYRDIEAKVLPNASKSDVLDGLEWLEKQATQHDVVVALFSGHGYTDPRSGQYYFASRDIDFERLKSTSVPYTDIKNTVVSLPSKVLFFVDTCHSGAVMDPVKTKGFGVAADVNQVAMDLASAENGVVVFASSTGTQLSEENAQWGNGAFTKAIVEGLNGQANYQKDNRISINELDLYLSERVKQLTNGRQTPTTTKPKTIPDFPIVMVQ